VVAQEPAYVRFYLEFTGTRPRLLVRLLFAVAEQLCHSSSLVRAAVCMGAVAIIERKQRSEQFCGASFAKLNYSSEQSSKYRNYLRNYIKKYFKKCKCYDRKAFSAIFESFLKK